MENPAQPVRPGDPPADRLYRLSEASRRINQSLDFDTVLQGALDSARSLTGARYGVMTLLDDAGAVRDFLSSGMSGEEAEQLWQTPERWEIFERLGSLPEPLRIPDLVGYVRSLGFAEFSLPLPAERPQPFLASQLFHGSRRVGNIFLAGRGDGLEFSPEDQQTLVMFASQAALVIANARAYREERRARAGLETLVDTSPVGVVVFDALSGAPRSFNREARRIADSLREEGQTPEMLLDVITCRRADGREVSLREFPLAGLLSVAETLRAEEMVLLVPSGRSVTVLLNATPIRSDGGAVESVVVTMQDLAPLAEQERVRAEFLGMVSHELRMPLTSVRGAAATLLETAAELDPAEMRQFFRIIVEQSERMRELIGKLLDVARIETGTLPVDPEPAEVAALVDRARNAFTSAGGSNELEIDVAPDLPMALADRRRIVQVIGNLLSNAARHSPESSVIRVSAARVEDHVQVSVADQGRGIPADDLPGLFRRFSGRERDGAGGDAGLGLAICKGIVEAHGGRIWAESDGPGLGARFTFTLPAAPEAQPARRPRPRRGGGPSGGTVLVVDDDPLTLRSVRDALSAAGFRPVTTGDPQEAMLLIAEENPCLVLLDLVLPEMDGVELMEDLLAVSRVPVVFLSVYGRDEVIARALEQGATDYIVKPFSPTELVARVRAALRRFEEPRRREEAEPFLLGELAIDYGRRRVTLSGEPVELTAIEFDLLAELSAEAPRVVSRDRLLRRVWSPGKPGSEGALRTHLMRLRRKLGEDGENPRYIFAEPRVGYWMPEGETVGGD